MAAILGNSAASTVIIVVRTQPQAILLAMITMTKSAHGFPFFPIWVWSSAWQPFRSPELSYKNVIDLFNAIQTPRAEGPPQLSKEGVRHIGGKKYSVARKYKIIWFHLDWVDNVTCPPQRDSKAGMFRANAFKETSGFKSLYSGQLILSTQLTMKPGYPMWKGLGGLSSHFRVVNQGFCSHLECSWQHATNIVSYQSICWVSLKK